MRRATMGVLTAGLSITAIATSVWSRTPRAETVQTGPVELVGLGVFRDELDIPAALHWSGGYSTTGKEPLALYLRLPASAGNLPGSDEHGRRASREITATLILPNGSTAPLSLQRLDLRRNGAMVQIRRDYPPDLPYLDVRVSVPGERPSQWRVRNLPGGTVALDFGQPRTEVGRGPGRVVGRAWWERGHKPGLPPALYAAVSMPGLRPRAGETCEMERRVDAPFAQSGMKPYASSGTVTSSTDGGHETGLAISTPYAGYAPSVRVEGVGRRYRYFDETIDFGTVPLRKRDPQHGRAEDAEPAIARPRSASTESGLRLNLPARATGGDHMSFGSSGLTLSFYLQPDRATLSRGLPADMAAFARRHPVEVQVEFVGSKNGWVTASPRSGNPEYMTWWDVAPQPLSRFSMRMRVRRRVLVEEFPYRLVLPVARQPRRTAAPHTDAGVTFFEIDSVTLEPKPSRGDDPKIGA